MKREGFTLVELMVVVAIVAVLAALAIPQYQKFVFKSIRAEAVTLLKAVHKGEMSYYSTYDQFYPKGGAGTTAPAVQANEYFGLGPVITARGWRIHDYNALGPVGSSQGYLVETWNDFDNDGFHDIFYVIGNLLPCANGIPLHVQDDIQNVNLGIACP